MVWSLEEEEGKERRGGIRGGRGRQAGGMMGKEENAMRKWGEEEDKHAEDLAGSEEGTAGSFYNIRWISKFSDSSPHRLMDLPDGSHQRDHAQTTAGPGGYVHVYFTFEIKKRQKKTKAVFWEGSLLEAQPPQPPRPLHVCPHWLRLSPSPCLPPTSTASFKTSFTWDKGIQHPRHVS